jgi:cell division protein FtsL
MNAAARLVNHHGALSRSWVVSVFLTKYHFMLFTLIITTLVSSLGLVYVTNETRSLNANLQKLVNERDRLHVEWGQLLLERSTLTIEPRIQNFAEKRLNMVFPEGKKVVQISRPK